MDEYHEQLLKELPSLGDWHHKIDLGEGKTTTALPQANYNPEMRWKLIEPYLPDDLNGKSVLDLGCNSGYLSMKMKKRGASKVVAVDISSRSINQAEWIKKWFDVDFEVIQEETHVYCLTTEERFDYVIFFGLFYHLKYPVLVLDRVAEMTKEKLFFQTVIVPPIIEDFVPKENYEGKERFTTINSLDFPRIMFLEGRYNTELTTWWISNEAAVISLLRNAKLKIIEKQKDGHYVCEPNNPHGKKVYNKLVFPKHGKFDWSRPNDREK